MTGAVATLAIVVPLAGATAVMASGPWLGRRLRDAVGIVVAVATLALTLPLAATDHLVVSWTAGWRPVDGLAIGIPLTVDPLGAGIALLAALLASAALTFSWRYFEKVGVLYHTLMLLFLGGMVGFALTGDLFNLFVFFELLTTAAYALTAYDIERQGPLHGALNFAVTNTVGAFLLLHGIALLYARTGTLAFAEIGRELAAGPPDVLLVASFALLSAGLFTKAAIVPFHFWLADAHAVAPSPVSVLLSGVMIELGLYGWARIYWTVFAQPLSDHAGALRVIIVALGVVTAIVGGGFALAQHHLKRLLAFSSISHSGLILIGVGLLDHDALAGAGLYVLAHGCVKGALFLLAGIVLHRYGTVDTLDLQGRARGDVWTGMAFLAGALALAGLPPFGTLLGKQLIEEAASRQALGACVTVTFLAAGALTGAAVLQAAGRVFLGWGAGRRSGEEEVEDEDRETDEAVGRTPAVMIVPVVALLGAALAITLVPAVGRSAVAAAQLFVDGPRYAAAVLDGVPAAVPVTTVQVAVEPVAVALGTVTALAAVILAALALGRDRLPDALRRSGGAVLAAFGGVRRLQSGHVGDYVAWMTVGLGVVAGAFALALL